MATKSPRGGSRSTSQPKRALALFVLILVVVYVLVLFTGNKDPKPKLGIDLQGGTRVTLVPQGEQPTPDQLSQARRILENRVNGMGVSGAEVITDGNTLVITVPGEDTSQARALGQTSQLLFRPVANPVQPPLDTLLPAMGEMANRWVAHGVLTREEAQESLDAIAEAANTSAKAQAEAEKGNTEGDASEDDAAQTQNDSEAASADEEAVESAPAEVETVTAPTVDAQAPGEPANSIEAAERRAEVIDMLREDRQSTDPVTTFASMALLRCTDELDPMAGSDDPALPFVACDKDSGRKYALAPAPLLVGETDEKDGIRLTGNEIDTSRPITGGLNPQTSQMEINFAFKSSDNEAGGSTWAKLTQDYLQQQVAITLDSQVISAPIIQSPTPAGSGTSITGSFTQTEAQELANNLRYGALPLSFAGENGERGGTATTIPATLGFASLKAGLIAGIVGLILVSVFALAYYRVFGFLAVFTLFASGSLVYGALVLLGRWIGYSLDLAGVAGLIIGIGTTADSFVVLYERIKDEVRDGRTFRSAVPRAWARAKHTILSGNFVSIIAAVVLYILAVGDVKGFAFTLGLTTVFDLVIIFLVTAPLVVLASRKTWFANPKVNGLHGVMDVAARRRAAGEVLPADTLETVSARTGVSDAAGGVNTSDAFEPSGSQATSQAAADEEGK